ncbi:hypothetical protein H8356DRAFT_1291477 [Neocallimastix lanati (nom. inval.)]|nr:hypothetical protein H8356DRAFT_1291477 [Neocallimastix sp. JGI-2020a]
MEKNLIIDIKKIIQKFMYRNKCKSFIILNDKKEILKYDSSHNHPEKEYDVSLSIMKHKIKDGIEKSSIPYEMGLICSEYNSIKSQISRNLNKNYHPMEYNDDIFADELDSFYTTSFAILQNKEQEIYKIFKKLKKKKCKYL